jgi:hypothetical protein
MSGFDLRPESRTDGTASHTLDLQAKQLIVSDRIQPVCRAERSLWKASEAKPAVLSG